MAAEAPKDLAKLMDGAADALKRHMGVDLTTAEDIHLDYYEMRMIGFQNK